MTNCWKSTHLVVMQKIKVTFLVLVNEVQVQCLQKPYGICELQEFELEEDVIFCPEWFSMHMSTQRSRRGENGFGLIKK